MTHWKTVESIQTSKSLQDQNNCRTKIKSDKLDARILADLLRFGLVCQSYVPSKEFREKRSLIRHRISLVRNRTLLENKVHSLLDKYDCKTDLTDIFGNSGMC